MEAKQSRQDRLKAILLNVFEKADIDQIETAIGSMKTPENEEIIYERAQQLATMLKDALRQAGNKNKAPPKSALGIISAVSVVAAAQRPTFGMVKVEAKANAAPEPVA